MICSRAAAPGKFSRWKSDSAAVAPVPDDLHQRKGCLSQVFECVFFIFIADFVEFVTARRVIGRLRETICGKGVLRIFDEVGVIVQIHARIARLDEQDGISATQSKVEFVDLFGRQPPR